MIRQTHSSEITLDEAVEVTRTGDIWIFRGQSGADRAIQTLTNSPVNHVGMSVVLDDLPPLMWHAELGRSLPDMWTGKFHRGVQLHDLRAAVQVWGARYGQRGWLRQLAKPVTGEQEDALLRTIARLDGTPFPSSVRLASRWFGGRMPSLRRRASSPHSAGLERLLRRGGRVDVRGDGLADRGPAHQLVRPRTVLEWRPAAAGSGRRVGCGDRGSARCGGSRRRAGGAFGRR